MAVNKVYPDAQAALAGLLRDDMTIMSGGFGLCGIPAVLIDALRESGVKGLTIISNNAGIDDVGLGVLLKTRQVRKMISSYVGENATFAQQYLAGELEIEFNPQGTLAERIRAGGAGIPGFYTATGAGTQIAEGKETKQFDGRTYVLERGLRADLAVIHAWKADREGNLIYRKTARNFNPIMATAADQVVAEVEDLVDYGQIDPDHIITPGIFVNRIVPLETVDKRIEQRTVRKRDRGEARCPGHAIKWPPAPRANCATGSMSTSASAFRRWWRTTSPRACRSSCTRRTACSAWGRSRSKARRTPT